MNREGSTIGQNAQRKTSNRKNRTQEYQIEGIRGYKYINGEKMYRLKWKGYNEEACTFEPWDNLNATAKRVVEMTDLQELVD